MVYNIEKREDEKMITKFRDEIPVDFTIVVEKLNDGTHKARCVSFPDIEPVIAKDYDMIRERMQMAIQMKINYLITKQKEG